jgi:glucan biosynthesis protein C
MFAVGYALGSWCWVVGLTGLALRFLSEPNMVRRYMADASYWIYLVHYPLVLALQDALAGVRWHWAVKCPAIVLATLAISLVTYHYLVRFTVIGLVLNGPRGVRAHERPYADALPLRAPELGGR